MRPKTSTSLLCLALLIMAVPQRAEAYVDPGSGSMLWQLAAAAVFGSLFRIKRIAAWFRARHKRRNESVS
jgi:hypothetical protein